ncbi:MAG: DsbA family protein [Chloroflexi bacterium]|nr:DsbA family protein [Chloroflexota bacterium]
MGLARLDKLAAEFDIEFDFRAFMLHPEIPPEGKVRDRRPGEPEEGLSPRIAQLAEEEGIVMRRASLTPYTIHAQAITEYSKQFGKADEFHHAAYKALWEDGANLGDFDVLEGIATGVGLDWDDVLPRLETREYDRLIQDQFDEAIQLGVTGVPGFLIDDRFWFTGAQPMEMFRLAARKALEIREPEKQKGLGIGIEAGEG